MAWRRAFVVPATQLVLPGFSDLDEPAPWELPGYKPPSNQVDGYEMWFRRRLGGPHVPLPVCDDGELW